MSELRTKITRGWRPASMTPARRRDDFQEGEATALTSRTLGARTIAVQPARRASDIGRRLENWGAWANGQGTKGPDCMTGAICDRARRAALGDNLAGSYAVDRVNNADAERINTAFVRLAADHRKVLHWTYVMGAKDRVVAKVCEFPRDEYDGRLRAAQDAIESAAGPYLELRA